MQKRSVHEQRGTQLLPAAPLGVTPGLREGVGLVEMLRVGWFYSELPKELKK